MSKLLLSVLSLVLATLAQSTLMAHALIIANTTDATLSVMYTKKGEKDKEEPINPNSVKRIEDAENLEEASIAVPSVKNPRSTSIYELESLLSQLANGSIGITVIANPGEESSLTSKVL